MVRCRCALLKYPVVICSLLLLSCGGSDSSSNGVLNFAPVFTSDAIVNVDENQISVITVTATDANSNTITYGISGGVDQAEFNIGASSGVLEFNNPPNYEVPTDSDNNNVYLIVVSASDGVNISTQEMEITVNDITVESTTTPVFTSSTTVSVDENLTTVMTVTATDADGNTLYYYITGGVDASAFSIDVTSGDLSFVVPPDFESPTDNNTDNDYEVQVSVYDGVNTVPQVITVTVDDVVIESNLSSCFGGPAGTDTLYADQWHLNNTGQDGGAAGEDINVEPVWASCRGTGARIVIVDDGLEIGHEDLAANVVAGASHNYINGTTDPTGGAHGTAVAGVAAAVGFNGLGVRGVAPSAEMVGYNLLQRLNESNEADAMTRDAASNSVSSNSWGPQDNTGQLIDSSALWRAAIDTGLATGRGGNGLVYTWAAGNGHGYLPWGKDNSNYDGYANYHGVMAIAALNDQGQKASYSEPGANIWISAPAGEFCDTNTTTTTDRTGNAGYNTNSPTDGDLADPNYTQCFNGTSSATPVASGTVALMLEANPALGWRDVRQILAETARKNDAADGDWATNGAGLNINHKYGFGVIDALAAVNAAAGWSNLGARVVSTDFNNSFSSAIPDGTGTEEAAPVFGSQVDSTILVSASGITAIEFVELVYTSDHVYAGDLEIELESPAGTISQLAHPRYCGGCGPQYASGWRFGSVRQLGEGADGNWILRVRDGYATDTETNPASWSIKFYGH